MLPLPLMIKKRIKKIALSSLFGVGVCGPLYNTPLKPVDACKILETPYYHEKQKEDLQYYCSLPASTQAEIPSHYWLSLNDYETQFLNKTPTTPQAPRNVATDKQDDNAVVSAFLNDPNICQFYSIISPSVQSKRVSATDRLDIISTPQDLLNKCELFHTKIKNNETTKCSSIEFAGHSTQSIGLDAVIGISYQDNKKTMFPDKSLLSKVGHCLKKIMEPKGKIIFSTCGGEQATDGKYHFWPKKQQAQQELSNLFGLTIISGIGPVHFSSEYGHNGSESNDGWTITKPK